jgi:hypothetical protein
MRYLTPDLLERFGSADEDVAFAAHEEFERCSEEYARMLREIGGNLPGRFAEMQEQYYLHDARVMTPLLSWLPDPSQSPDPGRRDSFWIALRLDTPPGPILVLHYRSAVIERVIWYPSLREGDGTSLEWQYDEVDLARSDDEHEFRHSILFTQGLELRLRFKDFDFATLKPMRE